MLRLEKGGKGQAIYAIGGDNDAAIYAAASEFDPLQRAALYIRANDVLWRDAYLITVMHRLTMDACANTLRPVISGWTNETDNLHDRYREA